MSQPVHPMLTFRPKLVTCHPPCSVSLRGALAPKNSHARVHCKGGIIYDSH